MSIKNSIFIGDCIDRLKGLPSDSIAACITDPPYNYEFIGHKWDAKETERRKNRVSDSSTLIKHVPYGSGLAGGTRNKRWYEKNRNNILEYSAWTESWGNEVFRVCKPGAYVAVFNSTRTIAQVQVALEKAGFYARDILVFRKPSGIPKGFNLSAKLKKLDDPSAEDWEGWHSALRNEWEAIALLQKPLHDNYLKTFNEFGVGLMKTEQSDINGFQSNILEGYHERKDKDNPHPTVKSLSLMRKLVNLLVPPVEGNIVLDPFAGSGTTLLAAKKEGFPYVGIEIVPEYADFIEKRLASSRNSDIEFPNTLF